ncbi:MAG: 23S rRNA (pseudouridine(1915)-N(3))-methyltransferase RlmH [Sphingomonadales bacterium]|jgi:23S rRNA (pseudouridine1915-N3)-methyltransferase
MKISIIAVGKIGHSPEQRLVDRYKKRIKVPIQLIEVEEKRPIKGNERKIREGELLLDNLSQNAHVIILDELGHEFSSLEFSKKLSNFQDIGISDLVFIIGGPDGLSDNLKKRANMSISLGKMTWPHMMVRSMLVEQIYRAYSILQGHPYHKV